jgi:hypothetical protein
MNGGGKGVRYTYLRKEYGSSRVLVREVHAVVAWFFVNISEYLILPARSSGAEV